MKRPTTSLFAALLAAATFVLADQSVFAADSKADAEKHFKVGVALLEAEDWPAAAAEFERSVQLFPTKMGLFNLANAYRAMHRYQEALDTVDRIDRDFAKKLDPDFKDAMAELRRDIRGMVGHLRVRVEEAGAEVTVDGRVVGKSPLEPFVLAPGEHEVKVSLAGYVAQQHSVRINVGETTREKFDLEREKTVADVAPIPATPPTPIPAPSSAQPAEGGPTIKPVTFEKPAEPASPPKLAEDAASGPTIKPVEFAPSSADVGGSSWTVDQAIAALHSPDKLRRLAGLHRLANEPGPKIQMRIAALARFDGDPRIRYDAVKVLGARRESASLPVLRTIAVNDNDAKVRAAAGYAVSTANPSSTGTQPQGQIGGQGGAQQSYDSEGSGAEEPDHGHPYAFFAVVLTGTLISGVFTAGFGIATTGKRNSEYEADQITADSYRKVATGFGVTTGVLGLAALFGLIGGYYKDHAAVAEGTEPEVSATPGGLTVIF
jgi:hypothetical protein